MVQLGSASCWRTLAPFLTGLSPAGLHSRLCRRGGRREATHRRYLYTYIHFLKFLIAMVIHY